MLLPFSACGGIHDLMTQEGVQGEVDAAAG